MNFSFSTRALHVGSEPSLSSSSAVIPEISLSTTYAQSSIGVTKGFEYTRSANPNRLALERVLASLEGSDAKLIENLNHLDRDLCGAGNEWQGGPAALAMSSGSAATATVISALTSYNGRREGDQGVGHIISVGDVYGGSARYMLRVAGEMNGVDTSFVDMSYCDNGIVDMRETVEEREKKDREEDEEIVTRVEAAIRPNTRVSPLTSITTPCAVD